MLDDGAGFVFESGAIAMHVAESFPDAGLIPPPGSHERALVYQWVLYDPAEMEPPLVEARCSCRPTRSARRRREAASTSGPTCWPPRLATATTSSAASRLPTYGRPAVKLTPDRVRGRDPGEPRTYMSRLEERPSYQWALEPTRREATARGQAIRGWMHAQSRLPAREAAALDRFGLLRAFGEAARGPAGERLVTDPASGELKLNGPPSIAPSTGTEAASLSGTRATRAKPGPP